jgi:hypothetical protein
MASFLPGGAADHLGKPSCHAQRRQQKSKDVVGMRTRIDEISDPTTRKNSSHRDHGQL